MKIGRGQVALVGAGCGDADLITLRGLRLLQCCEAVVYDGLIDQELLSYAPEEAERIYMGKRSGAHSAPQEEINAALIRLARAGKRVVRLKGGDPFVFGRGGEELTALREAGIPCEEVPGISSAIAIPAAAGIPVTYRQLSQGVHIVTAHTAGTSGGLPENFDRLAGLDGTLVFLMGLRKLPEIVRRLIEAGKDPETPAAVLSGGNARHPVTVRGPLSQLPELAKEAQAPAVILVGPVAALELASTVRRSLEGLRVGLVGTPSITEKLGPPLRNLGARVFTALGMRTVPLPAGLTGLFGNAPWLVFTSGNAVRRFFQLLAEQGLDIRTLAACRFAVVGAATKAVLREYGVQADLCPEKFTTAALGEALLQRALPGEPLLLFRSAQASAELRETLEGAGRSVRDLRIYDVRPRLDNREGRAAELAEATHLVFASAGGVRSFLEEFGALPRQALPVCIGEVTAAALRARTDAPFLTAPEISAAGILQAILGQAAPPSSP